MLRWSIANYAASLAGGLQRTLNRGEAFHQLRSALMKISGKQLQGRTEFELAISNEGNRFLACCIIYYNCVLLSFLLGSLGQKKDKELYELITRLSPVAWQHINMIGKFQFLQNKKAIDIKSVINDLLDELKKSFKPLRSHNNPIINTSSNNKETSQ